MIDRIVVQHFRSIQSIDFRPGRICVLVGPNGSGKSNLLDALTFVRDALSFGLDHAISERQGIATLRQWAPTKPFQIGITLHVSENHGDGRGSFGFTLASQGAGYAIRKEEGTWFGTRYVTKAKGRKITVESIDAQSSYVRKNNDTVIVTSPVSEKPEKISLDDPDEFFINSRFSHAFAGLRATLRNFERYAIFPNTLRRPERASRDTYLSAHGENLSSIIKKLRKSKKTDQMSEILECLQKVIPNLKNIHILSLAGLLTPQFLVQADSNQKPHYFHVNQMSDGTLRILGILVALYQNPRPSTIAVEEPEVTVHPGVLRIITDSIREVSENTQIFVTTHSPELINHFAPSEIMTVEMNNGSTLVRALNWHQAESVKQRLLSLGELMSVEGLHG